MAEANDLATLRAEYLRTMGKNPFNGWGADELRERMKDAPEQPKPVKIVVTVDHIYLPLDTDGNCFVWEGASDTTKVTRRTRLLVHPDMARSLQDADKAEILDG